MTKLKIILLIVLIIDSFSVVAQQKNTLYGKVLDKETKEPLPFTTVVLTRQDNANKKMSTATIDNGQFLFENIAHGEYILNIRFLGYKEYSKKIRIGSLNTNYDIGKIELEINPLTLHEVSIIGRREMIASRLDKKSFNIADNISQAGGSVLDAMRNLPGVTVDQDGKVLLRGSDQVSVLIDGKQSSLTGFGNQKGLDNIPVANIERIEIINNPSAKYQASGMAGIINIIYKKEIRKGFNGDIAFHFGLGEFSTRKESLPNIMDKYSLTPKYNPSFNLNYRTPKVNVFLQSSGMIRKKLNSNEFITRTYTDGKPSIVSQFLENRNQKEYTIKAGLDWYINDKNEITFYGLLEDEYHIDKGGVPYDYLDSNSRKRLWGWAEDENTRNMNYCIDYTHKFEQLGHKLDASISYTHGQEKELFPFTDQSSTRNSTDSTRLIAKEKIAYLKLDYVKPLGTGRIEGGTHIQLRDIPISYITLPGQNSILDNNLGNWSHYKENIYALYANYLFESKVIDIEAGLRTEYASIKYDIDPRNIYYPRNESYSEFPLFPNIRISLKIDENNKFSLFYNRRTDRPGEFELRPFPKYDDPEILKTGNPYLRPQYTQNFEIGYKTNWKNGSLFISGYFKQINDIIARIYTESQQNTEVINSIPQNLGRGQNYGTEIVFEQQILPQWNLGASFNWYRNIIDAHSGTALYPYIQPFYFEKSSSNTWNTKINSDIQIPSSIDIQCSFIYYAPDIIPQGKIDQRYSLDVGVRKKIMKEKLELSLSASDILNTFALKKTINGVNFLLKSDNYYETQTLTIGIKYKF